MSNPKNVTREEVEKIARLSRLQLSGEELDSMTQEFNQILQFVNQIENVDTKDVEPIGHVLGQENVRREDVPGISLGQDALESIAPAWKDSFFVVPQVIDRNN